MAGTGTKLMVFLITFHALMYYAGANGLMPLQQGQNPQKAFVNNVSGEQFQQAAQPDTNSSGFFSQNLNIAFGSLEGIDAIWAFITNPYMGIGNSGLPDVFKLLLQSILGFLESIVVISFVRGKDF